MVGARQRLARVAGRDLLGPRRPLRHHRRRLIRKRLVSSSPSIDVAMDAALLGARRLGDNGKMLFC